MTETKSTTTTTPPLRPRVGVAVFVTRKAKTTTSASTSANHSTPSLEFVMGQRRGSHGAGTWALPGGHLEFNESFETCAAREIMEETGLTVTNIQFLTATNDVMWDEGKHYITIFLSAELDGDEQEPQVLEPDKCEGWNWVTWEEFSRWSETGERNLFLPMVNLVKIRPGVGPLLS